METQQIILFGILLIAAAFYFQRWRRNKLIPQYEPKEVEILIKQSIRAVLLDVHARKRSEAVSRSAVRSIFRSPTFPHVWLN